MHQLKFIAITTRNWIICALRKTLNGNKWGILKLTHIYTIDVTVNELQRSSNPTMLNSFCFVSWLQIFAISPHTLLHSTQLIVEIMTFHIYNKLIQNPNILQRTKTLIHFYLLSHLLPEFYVCYYVSVHLLNFILHKLVKTRMG
jgi:hypothetical protein